MAVMMVDLYRHCQVPLSHERLWAWQAMLMRGRRDLRKVGCYRTRAEPVRVVSGAVYAPKIHFEAPPAARVPQEMARFLEWFAQTAPGGVSPLPALTRAGIAHLSFVCIHPFEDGNGRVARALAEMALAQSLGQPTLAALSQTIERHQKAYDNALARRHQPLAKSDHARVAVAVGGQLPDQGHDDVADQQHDAEEVEGFQQRVAHAISPMEPVTLNLPRVMVSENHAMLNAATTIPLISELPFRQ